MLSTPVARRVSAQLPRQLSTAAAKSEAHVVRMELPRGVKAGTGGRHSRNGISVAVFGATGFLGAYVCNQLGKSGSNMVVATRGDDLSWRHLKVCADYGKLVPSYVSIKDEQSIRETISGCDAVINMIGKHYETKHYVPSIINCSFQQAHVEAAELVARVAREEEVKHLVHVSCAYANKESSSEFARTKAEGEERVQAEFPGAVVVRPNVMYGESDRFLSNYAGLIKAAPYVPLVEGMEEARVAPVFVGDVGRAIAQIAQTYSTAGSTFNLSGVHQYTHKQIFEYIMQQIFHEVEFVSVPFKSAAFVGRMVNNLPNPYITEDFVKLLCETAPIAKPGEKTFRDLGAENVALFESRAKSFLYRHREGGHFVDMPDHSGHQHVR